MGSKPAWRWLHSPYLWITVAALLWIAILDAHSWWQQYRLSVRLQQMQAQYEFYQTQIQRLKAEETALLSDRYTQQYYARKHYWVKKPEERLFLLQRSKELPAPK